MTDLLILGGTSGRLHVSDNFVEDRIRGYSATHMIMDDVHFGMRRGEMNMVMFGRTGKSTWQQRLVDELIGEYANQQSTWKDQPKTYYAAKEQALKAKVSNLLLGLIAASKPLQ